MDLGITSRRRRVVEAAQNILAHNVCPKTLENDGIGYLKNNIILAKDVPVYLDSIKFIIIQDVMIRNITQASNF